MKTLKKIAIISLIAGIALIGVAFGMGLENYSIGTVFRNYKYEDKMLEIDEDVKELSIKMRTQEVKISQGDSNKTKITYKNPKSKSEELIVNVESSKINIEEKNKWNSFLSFMKQPNYQIEVELAKDTKLSVINFDGDVGHADINGVNANGGKIKLDVGDIVIKNSKLNNAEISVDVGNIDLKETTIQNSKVKANVGDIKGDFTPSGDVTMTTDTGSVNVTTPTDDYSVELKSDVGDTNYKGQKIDGDYINTKENSETTLKISTDVGDIRVKTK